MYFLNQTYSDLVSVSWYDLRVRSGDVILRANQYTSPEVTVMTISGQASAV